MPAGTTRAPDRPAHRSLWPREHGAYAQLAAPLLAGLAVRAPGLAAALLATGACLAFLAHEPLLVVLGHRGRRQQDAAAVPARRRLIVLGGLAALAGVAGLVLAPPDARVVALATAGPVAILLVLAWRKAEHSLPGELVAAAALSGAAAPVAVASGLAWRAAGALWLAWALGFAATVIAVHRVIARNKRPGGAIDVVAAVGVGALALGSIAVAVLTAHRAAAVTAPLALLSAVLIVRPPKATRLRAIGVALTIAAAVAAGLAIASG